MWNCIAFSCLSLVKIHSILYSESEAPQSLHDVVRLDLSPGTNVTAEVEHNTGFWK